MANFTQNISNSVRCFGGGPSTKWGQANGVPYTMTWGTSTWGEGESLPIAFRKVIENSLPVTWDYTGARATRAVDFGSFSATQAMGSSTLSDGSGLWKYVFTSDTTSQNERDFASWTESAQPDMTFTCQPAGSTSWSEV